MPLRSVTLPALLAAALVLSACGGDDPGGTASGHGSSHGASAGKDGSARGTDADVAFLAGMTPHHEQAVEMSDTVLAADPPADVAALARRIKAAQGPEIAQMRAMLQELGAPADPGSHGGGHAGSHGGMMSEADMEALRRATGVEAARLYLEGMVEHHRGAVEASEQQIEQGRHAPAVALARTIAAEQTAEIAEMERLLAQL